jgi:Cu/Ag efflux pump CusA
VLILAFAVMAYGGFTLQNARVDVLPEFDAPIVEVQAEALGLSAAEVEDLVTINLEEILTAAPYLQSIHSKSVPSLSSVLLTFEPGTDLMRARQMVQERLTMAWALPNVSKPPLMLQPKSAASRAMIVGLSSREVSLIDMSVLARWTMTPKLLSVPGVANVAIWGQRARQLQVQVDPRRLQAKGVTLNEVIESAGDSLWVSPLSYLESSVLGTGGWIDTPNQRLGIQHVQPISRANDLAKVAIEGSPLTLGDVATVVEGHPPLIGDAVVNDGAGIILVIEKFPNASATAVAAGVEKALAELSQGMPGIKIDSSIYNASRYVEGASANLGRALVIGGGLMAIAVFLSFLALGPAILTVVAIALSFVAALLVLYFRGVTLSIMHMVGLAAALSMVVDGAIVAAEAIVRRRREYGSARPLAAAVYDAMGEVRHAATYSTLIGLLVIAPVFALSGEPGAFFGPLAQSYVLALIAALAVTFLVVPGLALLLFRDGGTAPAAPAHARFLPAGYESALSRFSAAAAPAYALAVLGALVLGGSLALLQWSPVPAFKERDVVVTWEAAPGTSQPAASRMLTQLSDELRAIKGVRSAAGHIGRAITGDQVTGIESGQVWVGIDGDADYDRTIAAIRETVQSFPDIEGKVQTYLTGTAQKVAAGAGDPIVVRIEGAEPGILDEQAKRVAEQLAQVNGVGDVRIDERVMSPEIQVKVDVATAAKFGLKPGDVRRTAATVFSGLEVGNLFDDQKVFEVVVWGANSSRHSITDVEDLLIDAPNGRHVRLGDVAEVKLVPTQRAIERAGVTRSIDIHASVQGRTPAGVQDDVRGMVSKIEFPLEYHAYVLDDFNNRTSANWQLMLVAGAAALLIFFVLQAAVQSWRLAFALFLSLLAALSGGMVVTLLTGGTVLLGSLAGLLAVLGLAVRNSLVMVNRLAQIGSEIGGEDNVSKAACERFWPVVSSAAVTALAFVPVVVIGDASGLEILQPMTFVVFGGLITAVLVNLFVVPALLRHAAARPQELMLGDEHHALS